MQAKPEISMQTPRQRLSREEIAQREIGRTDITPALAWAMVALFVATILAVPTAQSIVQMRGHARSATEQRWPSWCNVDAIFRGVAQTWRQTGGARAKRVLAANGRLLQNIHEYERRLEDQSFLTARLLGPVQYWLTRLGGVGNEQAYIGTDGWLFYRPSVDYLTGPGFLDPASLSRRASGGNEYAAGPQPDPRPAILQFQASLAQSGVRLVLMPTPTKLTVEPERLAPGAYDRLELLQNPSFERFKCDLEAAGVLLFDPAPDLLKRKQLTGRPQFLKTDTHWNPGAMQAIAERLNQFIADRVQLPAQPARKYGCRSLVVRNLGDVAIMLKLPRDQDLFPMEEVTIRQILESDGRLWGSSTDADVLLLGDSFTNIYSMAEMNWGESAGFAEQLSFTMKRAVDRIAQNDAGAYATRQGLALELLRGKDRLSGKRVLIWQFAIRELAAGNWKLLTWPDPRPIRPAPSASPTTDDAGLLLVSGRINAISRVPEPGRVPYRDAIVAVHLADVRSLRGTASPPEVVVYLWGLRDNRQTSAARYRGGQTMTLRLVPWEEVQGRYGRFTRVELDDSDFRLVDLPAYWAVEFP
jgi:alginate O-acetyltransferase complex protein AlgJ